MSDASSNLPAAPGPDDAELRDVPLRDAQLRDAAGPVDAAGDLPLADDGTEGVATADGAPLDLVDAVDAEAVAGRTPRSPDLLDRTVPFRLEAAGRTLVVDPDDGTSTLTEG